MIAQRTVYCGRRHRTSDGVPIEHPCRILLPEFLEAERREKYDLAVEVLEAMPIVLHPGVARLGEELEAT